MIGYYSPSGYAPCAPCAAGDTTNGIQQTSCVPQSTVSPASASASPTVSRPPTVLPTKAPLRTRRPTIIPTMFPTVPSACQPGYISSTGLEPCVACNEGSTTEFGGSTVCSCLAGYFGRDGVAPCFKCRDGYISAAGQSSCTLCAGFAPCMSNFSLPLFLEGGYDNYNIPSHNGGGRGVVPSAAPTVYDRNRVGYTRTHIFADSRNNCRSAVVDGKTIKICDISS